MIVGSHSRMSNTNALGWWLANLKCRYLAETFSRIAYRTCSILLFTIINGQFLPSQPLIKIETEIKLPYQYLITNLSKQYISIFSFTFYPSITFSSSQSKELSYSELDLRKPKRFATFSFGLRKRKKRDEENMSKSTFGLHGPGIEEQEEVTSIPCFLAFYLYICKMWCISSLYRYRFMLFCVTSPSPQFAPVVYYHYIYAVCLYYQCWVKHLFFCKIHPGQSFKKPEGLFY